MARSGKVLGFYSFFLNMLIFLISFSSVSGQTFSCPCTGIDDLNLNAGSGKTAAQLGLPESWISSSGGLAVPDCIAISGRLIIPAGWEQSFAGVNEIRMQPGSEIVVQANPSGNWLEGGKLRLSQNNVHGCETMWRGITVETNAHLALVGITDHPTILSDAQFAVRFLNQAHLDRCQFVEFSNNHIGLFGESYFHSWANPYYGNLFESTGLLLDPFDSPLEFYSKEAGFAGIFFRNNPGFNLHGFAEAPNRFEGLRNGIIANNCNFQVWNTFFTDLAGEASIVQNINDATGIGIRVEDGVHTYVQECDFNGADDMGIDANNSSLTVSYSNAFDTYFGIVSIGSSTSVINNNTITIGRQGVISLYPTDPIKVEDNTFLNTLYGNFDKYAVRLVGQSNTGLANSVARNIMNLKYFMGTAVDVQSGLTNIVDNTIDFSQSLPSETKGHIGIVSLAGQTHIVDNDIENSDAPGVGVLLSIYPSDLLCGNTINGFDTGFLFSSQGHSHIRHNTFGPGNTVAMQSSSYDDPELGVQIPQTNNNFGGKPVRHFGNMNSVLNSVFYESSIPPLVFPLSGWFLPSNTSPSFEPCDNPLLLKNVLSINQLKTINDFYSDDVVKTWETKRSVYRQLVEHPELKIEYPAANKFFINNESTTIRQLYQVDKAIDDLYNLPEDKQQKIDAYRADLDGYTNKFHQLSKALYGASSEEEANSIRDKLKTLTDEILPKSQWLMDTKLAMDQKKKDDVAHILSINDAVQDISILASQEKEVNKVYLQVILDGQTITASQQNRMEDIAWQCPNKGGKSVLKARNILLALGYLYEFDDDEICENRVNERKATSFDVMKSDRIFTIQPNPTKNFINVLYALDKDVQNNEQIRVDIINYIGSVVRSFNFSSQSQSQKLDLDMSNGIYAVNFFRNGKYVESQTIVVVK